MAGKATLFLVLAFSAIFALMARDLLNFTNQAEDNYLSYYNETNLHNIAVSGANMAASQIFFNKSWSAGYSNLSLMGGKLNVTVDTINTDERKIISVASYNGDTDTIVVCLQPKNFAQYGNFYNVFGSVWAATGDTFSGPFHTNDYVNCYGDPVFLGYTTSLKGIKLYDNKSHPKFLGGTDQGINVPLEFDTSSIRVAAFNDGKVFRDTTNNNKVTDLDITFNADATVKYRIRINNAAWTSYQTVPLTTLAPNGVIYVEKGNVFVKGTVNGQATLFATKKGSSSAGKIHIEDDVVYNKDPRTDPTSTDLLGMVAEQNVQLDYDASRGDVNIDASMYSQNGGLVVQNYSSYPSAYKMNILGGVIGQNVEATATYAWDPVKKQYVPTHGYSYVHKYDERFAKMVPPYFPKTKYFKVVSWRE